MSTVSSTIIGTANFPSQCNLLFGNLENLTDGSITYARPDCYDGSLPLDLNRQIREDLGPYISPSTITTAPCLPNFFFEGKGPFEYLAVGELEALYDGALGARGIAKLRAYVDAEAAHDNNAYVFSSTYDPRSGTLKLYAHHCTPSTNPDRDYDYHMTQVRAYNMTDTLDDFQRGASALRHARDLAREHREELISAANSKVPDAERSERATSTLPNAERSE
ncbi:hypothetical protein MMC07_000573 [Pseudocyphellaria aurata]|nr:hypothetical protein [Pseudocyphellaria aurata]